MPLQISLTGGTIQQLWSDQLKTNASTSPDPGHQYGEKNEFFLNGLFLRRGFSKLAGKNLYRQSKCS
jgi:hypothetical protein